MSNTQIDLRNTTDINLELGYKKRIEEISNLQNEILLAITAKKKLKSDSVEASSLRQKNYELRLLKEEMIIRGAEVFACLSSRPSMPLEQCPVADLIGYLDALTIAALQRANLATYGEVVTWFHSPQKDATLINLDPAQRKALIRLMHDTGLLTNGDYLMFLD